MSTDNSFENNVEIKLQQTDNSVENNVKTNLQQTDNSVETKLQQTESPMRPITKKDPRRVEQGKRLAAISKAAKEKKMRQKLLEEQRHEQGDSILVNLLLPVGLGVASFVFGVWIMTKMEKGDVHIQPVVISAANETQHEAPASEKKKFETLD